MFVAFCSYFPGSLTVVHKGRQQKSGVRQQKSGGRQQKSSRAGQQNYFFKFQPYFNLEIHITQNARTNHGQHSGLNFIFC